MQLVVQSSSGHEQVIVSKPDETTGSPYLPTWIDAEHLTYVAMRQMECPVFKVDAIRGTAALLGRQSLNCFGGSKIGIGGSLLMTRHSLENPGEVITTAGNLWSPKALSLQPGGPRLPWRAEAVSWQSKDGDYLISGVLIRAVGRQADQAMLVSVPGGPAMVTPDSYNDDAPFLPYGPLMNGFSILIPNTRGRGGYGRDFEAAIRDRKDYVEGPLEDVLGGVDYAAKRLGTPRSRMALAGFQLWRNPYRLCSQQRACISSDHSNGRALSISTAERCWNMADQTNKQPTPTWVLEIPMTLVRRNDFYHNRPCFRSTPFKPLYSWNAERTVWDPLIV